MLITKEKLESEEKIKRQIAENLDIGLTGINKALRTLSGKKGKVDDLLKIANQLGYDLEFIFIKRDGE